MLDGEQKGWDAAGKRVWWWWCWGSPFLAMRSRPQRGADSSSSHFHDGTPPSMGPTSALASQRPAGLQTSPPARQGHHQLRLSPGLWDTHHWCSRSQPRDTSRTRHWWDHGCSNGSDSPSRGSLVPATQRSEAGHAARRQDTQQQEENPLHPCVPTASLLPLPAGPEAAGTTLLLHGMWEWCHHAGFPPPWGSSPRVPCPHNTSRAAGAWNGSLQPRVPALTPGAHPGARRHRAGTQRHTYRKNNNNKKPASHANCTNSNGETDWPGTSQHPGFIQSMAGAGHPRTQTQPAAGRRSAHPGAPLWGRHSRPCTTKPPPFKWKSALLLCLPPRGLPSPGSGGWLGQVGPPFSLEKARLHPSLPGREAWGRLETQQ